MKIGYLIANAICAGAQCVIATLRPEGYIWYQIPFVIAIVVINYKALAATVRKLLSTGKGKKQSL